MRISLSKAGKRFNREWIFRHVNLDFESGKGYAITGANGSGKSTLLQAVAGILQLSEGTINYTASGPLPQEKAFSALSYCAPYLDVVEEMTLAEFLHFHEQFKPFVPQYSIQAIIARLGLEDAAEKQIRYFSSGMKQRVKLAQALFSNTAVVLLDEPCSNLDLKGIDLYHALIHELCTDRLVIVCSNDEVEYAFCEERISMQDYKVKERR